MAGRRGRESARNVLHCLEARELVRLKANFSHGAKFTAASRGSLSTSRLGPSIFFLLSTAPTLPRPHAPAARRKSRRYPLALSGDISLRGVFRVATNRRNFNDRARAFQARRRGVDGGTREGTLERAGALLSPRGARGPFEITQLPGRSASASFC